MQGKAKVIGKGVKNPQHHDRVLTKKHHHTLQTEIHRREKSHSEQHEQNARNSDSGLETQLSNWQVFNIWDMRLQQMGSQRVN